MSWVADNAEWLEPYVNDIRDQLGLSQWRVYLSSADEDADYQGQVQIPYGRHVATIRLSVPESPECLRNTVVHELLHCQFERITWAFNNFQDVVGSIAWTVGNGAYTDALEVTIDALSGAIAPMLPLPENEIRMPVGKE